MTAIEESLTDAWGLCRDYKDLGSDESLSVTTRQWQITWSFVDVSWALVR